MKGATNAKNGIVPTGTLQIPDNGTYNVTNYAYAEVNVSGGGTAYHKVYVIDYDGRIIDFQVLAEGATYTFPTAPTRTGLTFQEWACPQEITNNTITIGTNDVIAGAIYTTTSGANEFDITLDASTGKTVSLSVGTGTVDWGGAGTQGTGYTYTYDDYGSYTISISGGMLMIPNVGLFGQTSASPNTFCTAARFAFTPTPTSSVGSLLNYCTNLTKITIANTLTSFCGATKNTGIETLIVPNSVIMNTGSNNIMECYNLTKIVFSFGISSIQEGSTRVDYLLFPSTYTSVSMVSHSNDRLLTKVVFLGDVTAIGLAAFLSSSNVLEYDFTHCTSVPTLPSTMCFSPINQFCKILVPKSLEASWKEATNWISYANYIVGV